MQYIGAHLILAVRNKIMTTLMHYAVMMMMVSAGMAR